MNALMENFFEDYEQDGYSKEYLQRYLNLWADVLLTGCREGVEAANFLHVHPKEPSLSDSARALLRRQRHMERVVAKNWLFSKATTPGTFQWICGLFGYDPAIVLDNSFEGKFNEVVTARSRAAVLAHRRLPVRTAEPVDARVGSEVECV